MLFNLEHKNYLNDKIEQQNISGNQSLHDLLKDAAENFPYATAIGSPQRTDITYEQLFQHIQQVVATLNSVGIGRNDRVAIVLPNGPEMVSAFLAVAAGATSAPLNPQYRENEFHFYLSDLQAKALIIQQGVQSPARTVAKQLGIPVLELVFRAEENAGLFHLLGGKKKSIQQGGFSQPEDIALVLHTSGTTSRPKIVPLSHENICISAHHIRVALDLSQEDRCLNIMPLFHIHGLMGATLSSIAAGSSIFCTPGFYAPKFFGWMREIRPTWYTAVPTMHQAILARAKDNQEVINNCPLRFIRSSSASLAPQVLAQLEQVFRVAVIESYGMTEASHQMASNPLPPQKRKAGSVGVAAGPEVAIMDEEGEILPPETVGEIVIRGSNVTKGYENNPEANKDAFTKGWFRTGDQGRMDAEGYLYITGRIKEIINRGGEKISPREIDEVLMNHEAVLQAVAFAVPHSKLGEEVAAAVVLREGIQTTPKELQNFVAAQLADFKIPRKIAILQEIPKGPTGKLQRIGLAEKLGVSVEDDLEGTPGGPFAAANTHIEKQLFELWQKILGIKEISIYDNFFQLGGDSILAADIISNIQKQLEVEISFVDFLQHPTISDLGNIISNKDDGMDVFRFPTITANPNKNSPFPLNDIQQAYWIGRSGAFELGNVSTHLYIEVAAKNLQIERFRTALHRLIDRHDMLRVVILADGQQKILEKVPAYPLEVIDLHQESSETVERELCAIRNRMSHQVLQTDQWPLFEICACQLSDGQWRVHFSFDALILDAWSRLVFFQEWQQFYHDPAKDLAPLEISFCDYVLAERKLKNSPLYYRSRDYWWQRLSDFPPAPQLPLAKDPASIDNPQFARQSARLAAKDWLLLQEYARKSGITASGLLLAVFAEVLQMWSKNSRFCINLTFFHRLPLHPQVNNIIGDFTSLILLEVGGSNTTDSFSTRVQKLQRQLWQDMDHRYISGIEVMRELLRRQQSAPKAMMPIVFTSFFTHDTRFANSTPSLDWMGNVIYSASQTPQVWLDLQVAEENEQLILYWNYVKDLFPENMMEDMFSSYQLCLYRMAHEKQSWQENSLETLCKLLPSGQMEKRREVNLKTAPLSGELLHTLFATQATKTPEQPAIISPSHRYTYQELYQKSLQTAHTLQQLGARPNTLIAIVMEKGWEQIVAALGILFSGAAYLPIGANTPEERIHFLLQHGEATLVLTTPAIERSLEWPGNVQTLCITCEIPADLPTSVDIRQKPEDLAYVIYTSGSTGVPKGVMIEHRGAVNTILDINQRFGVNSNDRILALSSLSFDLSVYDIFGILAVGGTIVVPAASEAKNPAHWLDLIRKENVTIWNSVPLLMDLFVEYLSIQETVPQYLRLALLSGDWIPTNLSGRLRRLIDHIEIVSLGGATEASIWSILYPIDTVEPDWKSIPYGMPMTNQQFHVLNKMLAPCPVWTTGDLYIGGVGLARGYWREEEKTSARFIHHPVTGERLYKTGDLGRYFADGNIEFLGREDFQVKIHGYRVELGEIETVLKQHSDVKTAVVCAKNLRGGKKLVAYIVTSALWDSKKLHGFLQQKLPDYMLPSFYVQLDALPLSSNGKIDYNALPTPQRDSRQWESEQQKDTSIIAQVVELIDKIVPSASVNLDENLLSLGATSLEVIKICNTLESHLHFRPSIGEIYHNPTAMGIARLYQEHLQKRSESLENSSLAVLDSLPLIEDPCERNEFAKTQPGIRHFLDGKKNVQLAMPEVDVKRYQARRSYREFLPGPIPFVNFSEFLSCLHQIQMDSAPKYLYGSASSLYPVQVYFHIKSQCVENVEAGIYYYHPVSHRLVLLCQQIDKISRDIFNPIANGTTFDQSSFAIFLIAQMSAIVPMYARRSLHFATIEAGLITQLMETRAPEVGIGLCQMGSVDFETIRSLFSLENSHVYLHAFLGGLISLPETGKFEEGEI